jgi:AsmA-like protein
MISSTEDLRNTSTISSNRIRRIALVVSGIVLTAVIAGGVALATHWPFSRARVTQSLQETFPATVTFGRFYATYFPNPGCVAENVEFRRLGRSTDLPPAVTIARMRMEARYSDLFLRPGFLARIITEGFHVQVPPIGTPLDEAGWKETPSSTRIGEIILDGSNLTIGRRSGAPLVFDIHTLKLTDVSRNKPLRYALFMNDALPTGEIRAHGEFGPWNSDDAGQTSASGEYTFDQADLGNFNGISGKLAATGKFSGMLGHLDTQGKIAIPQFMVTHSEHAVRVDSAYRAVVDGTNGDVTLQQVNAAVLKTRVTATGKIAGSAGQNGKTATVDLNVEQGRIQDVLWLFVRGKKPPFNGNTSFRAHVVIPPGDGGFLQRVRVTGDFGILGGEFAKPSTQLAVDTLSEKAQNQTASEKSGDDDPDAVLTNLSGHVELTAGVANFRSFSCEVPGASAHMHGTYNLTSTAIDLHGTLKTEAELSQMSSGFKSALLKPFNGLFKKKHAGAVLPVHLLGTYHAPQAGLDIIDAAKDAAK